MPDSPGQGRVLWVATGHRVGSTGVIGGSGGGGAGQVDGSPQHEVPNVTHGVKNLQPKTQHDPRTRNMLRDTRASCDQPPGTQTH